MIKTISIQDDDNRFIEVMIGLLNEGKMVRTKTLGESMSPEIDKDDYLLITPINFSEVRSGDIIAYRNQKETGLLTGHRVIKKLDNNKEQYIITKGDANRFFDAPVHPHEIYGKVIKVEKNHIVVDLENVWNRYRSYLYAKYLWIKRYWNALLSLL